MGAPDPDRFVRLRNVELPLGVELPGPISDRIRADRDEAALGYSRESDGVGGGVRPWCEVCGARGCAGHPRPAAAPAGSDRVLLRIVSAAIGAGIVVLGMLLLILWVDLRDRAARERGAPLAPYIVVHTPRTYGAPGPSGGGR